MYFHTSWESRNSYRNQFVEFSTEIVNKFPWKFYKIIEFQMFTLGIIFFPSIRHKGMKSKKSTQSSSKQHASSSQRSLPLVDSTSSRTPGGSSLKKRPPSKPNTGQKGSLPLTRTISVDQSEASTSSQMESTISARTAVNYLTKRNLPSKSGSTSEEMIELLKRKSTDRGSDVGSDSERGLRTKASNSSSGQSEETHPLVVAGTGFHGWRKVLIGTWTCNDR